MYVSSTLSIMHYQLPFSNVIIEYMYFCCSPFWDIVLITSIDEEQKKCYEHQIELKKERNEIPLSVK